MRFYSLERSSLLLDIGQGTKDMGHNSRDGFMTINMNLDSFMSFEKLWVGGGGGWVHLDYNVSSGPFFEF